MKSCSNCKHIDKGVKEQPCRGCVLGAGSDDNWEPREMPEVNGVNPDPRCDVRIKALTYDDGKLPLAQLPWAALKIMAEVQLYGAEKYKDFNNYRKGMEVMRNLSCAMRHMVAYIEGEDNDPESGKNHLGHAMVRLAFVLQNIAEGKAIDDRYKKA